MQTAVNDRLLAYVLLFLMVVFWGSSLVVTKPIYTETTPFRFLFYRFSIAAILATPLLLYYWGQLSQPWDAIRRVLLIDTLGTTIGLGALYSALQFGSAIQTSLLTTTIPVFTAVAGVVFLHEHEEPHELLGTVLAFGGAVGLVLLPLLQRSVGLVFSPVGVGLGLIFSLVTSLYYILAKRYYHDIPKLFAAAVSFWLGAVSFYLISLGEYLWNTRWNTVDTASQLISLESLHSFHALLTAEIAIPLVLGISLYMGVTNSIIGLSAYFKAQDLIEASEAVLAQYLSPLVYIPLGIILLGERVSFSQMALLGVILLGVMIAEWRRTDPHASSKV